MRRFFDRPLDNAATYWRIYRRDGKAIGLISHDRSLRFGGVDHLACPGMTPAAIRRTASLDGDNAEVEGALSHASISEMDLAAGVFDGAMIEMGVVDWVTLEHQALYTGALANVRSADTGFVAELQSAKAVLDKDIVPRASPTCRAEFCGRGCTLSAVVYTHDAMLTQVDWDANIAWFDAIVPEHFQNGLLRFYAGPQTGVPFGILDSVEGGLLLDRPILPEVAIGTRARLVEGCDHTLNTCSSRFNNTVNFRGEPFVPGNDLLTRYGSQS